jgi:uncharacterized phage protein gp47/JayE
MPWVTPTLEELRSLNRDNVQSQLRSGPMIPNSIMRVMSDSNAGMAYLVLLYINWLALQIMPDTAESAFLNRFGDIWRPGGVSRKTATFATGVLSVTGIQGTPVPAAAQLTVTGVDNLQVTLQTNALVLIGTGPTNVSFVALTAGETGLVVGSQPSFSVGISGVDGSATVATIVDGVDEETDDELRARVLERIREPPMGGDAEDYVAWALAVPGVTRAWAAPNEMGVGTVTVRFMMDDLRATTNPMTNGFPNTGDIATVLAYLQTKRPVAVKDFFVEAPIPEPINFTINGLFDGSAATQEAIVVNVTEMLAQKASPSFALGGVLQSAQTIYAAWVSDAILAASGVQYFDLVMTDHVMPTNGSLAVMGTVAYTG